MKACFHDEKTLFTSGSGLLGWSHTYDIEIDLSSRTILEDHMSSDITGDRRDGNCLEVIKDLTPDNLGSGYLEAPMLLYSVPYIIEAHEDGHLNDGINIVAEPLYNEFKPLVDDLESRIDECITPNPYREIRQPFIDRANELEALYQTDLEKRVYERVENPKLLDFIFLLRKRARDEEWEETRCY